MSRICDLTGRGSGVGHNVSHANNKTKRKFMVNLQPVSMHSNALGRSVRLRVATATLRSVTRMGGLDAFLRKTPEAKLTPEAVRLKRQVAKLDQAPAKKSEAES